MKLDKKNLKRKWKGIGFIIPHFIGVTIFFLIPYIDVFIRSINFKSDDGIFSNYSTVIDIEPFILAVKNTVKFIVISLPLLIVLSLLVAVALNSVPTIENFIKGAMLIPLAIPTVSVVLMWRVMFSNNGFLNAALDRFGFSEKAWLTSGAAFSVLVISYLWKNLGYYVILWLAILRQVPETVYEAAALETSSKTIVFFRITLPIVKNSVFMIVVLAIVNSFKVFREAYLVAGDYPDGSMYLLQHIFSNWFRNMEVNKMAAGAVLTSIPLFILIFLFQKCIKTSSNE